jgi:DNA-3-methyladenine glycosylase II
MGLKYLINNLKLRSDPNKMNKMQNLTNKTYLQAVWLLANNNKEFKIVISKYGPPPFWRRKPGFPTLLYIILEQQVSLASARATFNKLVKIVKPLTPQNFIRLTDAELKTIGFSRQKTQYGRILADSILQRNLDLSALNRLDDSEVKSRLMSIKGIGSWTADIYLLLAMRRPDIWPGGDLAITIAVQQIKHMAAKPTVQELADLSKRWQPWRAVAARLLWHFYLNHDN